MIGGWVKRTAKQLFQAKTVKRINNQKEALKGFEALGLQAEQLAAKRGKTAEIKRPILTSHLSLVIRNKDENSRDEIGSVNTIQVAMDIAAAGAELGMETVCYTSQGNLRLQIALKEKGTV